MKREVAFKLGKELLGPLGRRAFFFGLLLVFLANTRVFSTNSAVTWDARDEMFFYFRWLGSAFHGGYFGDFIPNIASGYPIGANPQAGVYNIFYAPFWIVFPDSVLSINLLYLCLQFAIFTGSYLLFYTLRFAPVLCSVAALSVVANGFVTGHASHFSYLSTYLGWIVCFLGISLASGKSGSSGDSESSRGEHYFWGLLCTVLGVYHMATSGYPGLWISGAQIYILVLVYLLFTKRLNAKAIGALALGGVMGLVFAMPALMHFLNQLSLWPRKAGVSVEELLANALPAGALANFFWPYLDMGEAAGRVDFTMDRFHMTLVVLTGLVWGLIQLVRKNRGLSKSRDFLALVVAGIVLSVLAFGDNLGFPLKRFLAENLFFHRITRFPSGEFRGFALFAFSMASLWGLSQIFTLLQNSPKLRRAFLAFVFVDFVVVMVLTLGLRFMKLPEDMRGQQALFQVEYSGSQGREKLNARRGCPFDERNEFDQRLTVPDKFSWNGYTNLLPQAYTEERESMKWALCGPSRLWEFTSETMVPYELVKYSPSRIDFDISDADPSAKYLWTDVQDGYWKLLINEVPIRFSEGPASLRYFKIPTHFASSKVRITMIYAGPLSRFWR